MASSRPRPTPRPLSPTGWRAALQRRPWLVLSGIVVVGAWLRFHGIAGASLTHFDEGMYVISAIEAWQEGPWNFRAPLPYQAPPLFPWLIALAFGLTQLAAPAIGVAVSGLLATATIPLTFLLARRISGVAFGLTAAALLALSDLHVAFSRMALTDAPLTFWFVLSLYCTDRLADAAHEVFAGDSTHSRSGVRAVVGWTLAAGLATGGAWNTKYNGWMPIAIGLTAAAILLVRMRLGPTGEPSAAQRATTRGCLLMAGGLGVAGLIAGICYLPWYRYVESEFPGGYAAVVANHRTYFGGLPAWPDRAARLLASLPAFRHWGWGIGLAALIPSAAGVAVYSVRRSDRPRSPGVHATAVGLAAGSVLVAVLLGIDAWLALLAVAGIVPAVIWGDRRAVLLAVWVGAFAVLVPFYHPYLRLLVPAWPGVICLGLLVVQAALRALPACGHRETGDIPSTATGLGVASAGAVSMIAATAAGAALALLANPFGMIPTASLWSGRTAQYSYQAMEAAVVREVPEHALILCQAMPTAWLYFPRPFLPVDGKPWPEHLSKVPSHVPCYLLIDFHGLYSPDPDRGRAQFQQHLHSLEPVAIIPNDLRLATLLDYLPPQAVAAHFASDPARRNPRRLTMKDRHGRSVVVPPPLDEPSENIIVLYRIDRSRLD